MKERALMNNTLIADNAVASFGVEKNDFAVCAYYYYYAYYFATQKAQSRVTRH